MLKVYLTECPKCHAVYQVTTIKSMCTGFQCPKCKLHYLLIIDALACLRCVADSYSKIPVIKTSWCKMKKDIVLESPGCESEKLYYA